MTIVDAEIATRVVEILEPRVRQLTSAAKAGSWSLASFDAMHGLTVLNLWFPDAARWDAVIECLSEPAVLAEQKYATCQVLAAGVERLAVGVGDQIRAQLGAIAATEEHNAFGDTAISLQGCVDRLAIALGTLDSGQVLRRLASLAIGDWKDRRQLALILASPDLSVMEGALSVLAGDADVDVRSAAGVAVRAD